MATTDIMSQVRASDVAWCLYQTLRWRGLEHDAAMIQAWHEMCAPKGVGN